MILTGTEILKNIENKKIVVEPFNIAKLNPNSYNFTLDEKLLVYESNVLDAKKNNPVKEIIIPEEGLVLEPGVVYIGCTKEVMGSDFFCPIIRGRSSIGRLGLFVNITSDLIDIGAISQFTLQLNAVQPVVVYPNMQIGQVTFWAPFGDIKKYDGRYKGQKGPVASKMYLDFQENDKK